MTQLRRGAVAPGLRLAAPPRGGFTTALVRLLAGRGPPRRLLNAAHLRRVRVCGQGKPRGCRRAPRKA
eukprot:138548-Lingulodinium_polyedra.AAC.1